MNYNHDPNSGLSGEEHRRIVDAAVDQFKHAKQDPPKNEAEQLYARLGQVLLKVSGTVQQVIQAEKAQGVVNYQNLGQLTGRLMFDELRQWSNDDLLLLCVTMNTHAVLQKLVDSEI